MSENQAVALRTTVPAARKNGHARKSHPGARNFRFPGRAAKGMTVGQSAEDRALIADFIRDKGVTVLPDGYAFGAKPMPTFDSFAPPSY